MIIDTIESETTEGYDVSKYERPSVTVDVVIFSILDEMLQALLIKRTTWPYKDVWAIPGGFIQMDESLEQAAYRKLAEETGVTSSDVYLEQLYTFGEPDRDPRTRVITVAYFALVGADKIDPQAVDNVENAEWFSVYDLPLLAFDHAEILDYALTRLRYKLEYSAVGFQLLPERFTLRELQDAYEIVLGTPLDKGNFRSKLRKTNVVEMVDGYRDTGGRPARLYRFREDAVAEIRTRRLFP